MFGDMITFSFFQRGVKKKVFEMEKMRNGGKRGPYRHIDSIFGDMTPTHDERII